MISARPTLRWIARALFEGWCLLGKLLRPARHGRDHARAPRPVVTRPVPGVEVRVRLDRREATTGTEARSPIVPQASASSNALIEGKMEEAWKNEMARAEELLLNGVRIPDPSLIQSTGAVFQGAVTGSTDARRIAWVSVRPVQEQSGGESAS